MSDLWTMFLIFFRNINLLGNLKRSSNKFARLEAVRQGEDMGVFRTWNGYKRGNIMIDMIHCSNVVRHVK